MSNIKRIDKDGFIYYASGSLRIEKTQYPDGVGGSIWIVFNDDDVEDTTGICWDFSYDQIDDVIGLLQKLKETPIENIYKENIENE
jgi:hypothetical protein